MPERQRWRLTSLAGLAWLVWVSSSAALALPAWGAPAAPISSAHAPLRVGEPPALLIPVQGVQAADLRDTYTDKRGGGARSHEALDIMAPTGTPVLAVDDGQIAKLFLSRPGGITVYQFDPSGRFAYYYAHLDRYAPGLAKGQVVRRGQVLGYVGSSGNANPQAPHLHFALLRLDAAKRWWTGVPINPYPYLCDASPTTAERSKTAGGASHGVSAPCR